MILRQYKILLGLAFLTFLPAISSATTSCLAKADFEKIAINFQQLQEFARPEKTEYCETDLGPQWFKISEALVLIYNLEQPGLTYAANDVLTQNAIDVTNWWDYFSKRANKFGFNAPGCRDNVLAFVFKLAPGVVSLCPRFFAEARAVRASALIHEVRHFEGHRHVQCPPPIDSKNCDHEFSQGGSWAVSVQAFVALAKSRFLTHAEKSQMEASAIQEVFRRFFIPPQVSLESVLYLSDTRGGIWKWNTNGLSPAVQVRQLSGPTRLYTTASLSEIMALPVDITKPALRFDHRLSEPVSDLGDFAVRYNKTEDKSFYRHWEYNSIPTGYIYRSTLNVRCGLKLVPISIENFGAASLVRLPESKNDKIFRLAVLAEDGRLHQVSCRDEKVALEPLKTFFPTGLRKVVAHSKSFYGITVSGDLVKVEPHSQRLGAIVDVGISGPQKWSGITPVSLPTVFEER